MGAFGAGLGLGVVTSSALDKAKVTCSMVTFSSPTVAFASTVLGTGLEWIVVGGSVFGIVVGGSLG